MSNEDLQPMRGEKRIYYNNRGREKVVQPMVGVATNQRENVERTTNERREYD
jgi:hypothetical protein